MKPAHAKTPFAMHRDNMDDYAKTWEAPSRQKISTTILQSNTRLKIYKICKHFLTLSNLPESKNSDELRHKMFRIFAFVFSNVSLCFSIVDMICCPNFAKMFIKCPEYISRISSYFTKDQNFLDWLISQVSWDFETKIAIFQIWFEKSNKLEQTICWKKPF